MGGNLELVRSIYADWGRGDFSATEWAHPAIEFAMPDGVVSGSWTGVAEMARAWREVLQAWADFRAELETCETLDDERVLVFTENSGRGRTSGVDVGQIRTRGANVFHIRDGKVTRLVAYWHRDRALADLGLEEEAMPEESASLDLVERVQQIVAAMNARDFDTAVSFYALDAVLDAEDAGIHEGRLAIRSFYEVWWGSYAEQQQKAEEIRDLGNCVVIAAIHMYGRLPGAPAFLEQRYAAVATWRDGLIEKQRNYLDLGEARASAERLAEERG
jgi:ketosteroid isomerase-like protein